LFGSFLPSLLVGFSTTNFTRAWEPTDFYDEQGIAHGVWQGNDPTTELNYLMVKFPKTTFKTDRVKVTLATNVVAGWNEIDAVQLVGTDQ